MVLQLNFKAQSVRWAEQILHNDHWNQSSKA